MFPMSFIRRFPPSSRCGGLTLIEVLLAITIVTVGLTAIIAAASRCISVISRSRVYETTRLLLSRVEVEQPLQLEEEIKPGTQSGRFPPPYSDYHWTREIETVGRKEDGLFLIRTRVYWSERGREAYDEVLTYLYAPQAVQGGEFTR